MMCASYLPSLLYHGSNAVTLMVWQTLLPPLPVGPAGANQIGRVLANVDRNAAVVAITTTKYSPSPSPRDVSVQPLFYFSQFLTDNKTYNR